MTEAEKLARLRLIRTENVGPITFKRLVERYGSAARALEALPELAKRGLAGTVHLGDTTVAVRVERENDTVYALEVHRGGDETVNFVVLGGSTELFPTLCQRIEDMLSTTA